MPLGMSPSVVSVNVSMRTLGRRWSVINELSPQDMFVCQRAINAVGKETTEEEEYFKCCWKLKPQQLSNFIPGREMWEVKEEERLRQYPTEVSQ